MSVDINQISKGIKVELDGQPDEILTYQHVKPGKGQAFARIKLKNLKTGNVVEKTFKAAEKLKLADFEEKEMNYLQLLFSTAKNIITIKPSMFLTLLTSQGDIS